MLVSIVSVLAYLARDAGLEWRGISPLAGILIGALPLLAVDGWRYFAHPHQTLASSTRPPEARRAMLRAIRATAGAQAVAGAVPDPHFATPQSNDAAFPQIEGPLDQLANVLNGEGRATARDMAMSAAAGARGVGATDVASQVALARSGLVNLQASLASARSENPSLSEALDSALADAPFAELDAGLREFGDSASAAQGRYSDPAALRQAVTRLRGDSVRLERWISACNQRIADLKGSLEGAGGN
jgi:hypothetical protein